MLHIGYSFSGAVDAFLNWPTLCVWQDGNGINEHVVHRAFGSVHALSRSGDVFEFDLSAFPTMKTNPVDIKKADEIKRAIKKSLRAMNERIPDGFMFLLDAPTKSTRFTLT